MCSTPPLPLSILPATGLCCQPAAPRSTGPCLQDAGSRELPGRGAFPQRFAPPSPLAEEVLAELNPPRHATLPPHSCSLHPFLLSSPLRSPLAPSSFHPAPPSLPPTPFPALSPLSSLSSGLSLSPFPLSIPVAPLPFSLFPCPIAHPFIPILLLLLLRLAPIGRQDPSPSSCHPSPSATPSLRAPFSCRWTRDRGPLSHQRGDEGSVIPSRPRPPHEWVLGLRRRSPSSRQRGAMGRPRKEDVPLC